MNINVQKFRYKLAAVTWPGIYFAFRILIIIDIQPYIMEIWILSHPPIENCVETTNHAIFFQLTVDGVDGAII